MANVVKLQFRMDPFQQALFLFCGRRRDQIKSLCYIAKLFQMEQDFAALTASNDVQAVGTEETGSGGSVC